MRSIKLTYLLLSVAGMSLLLAMTFRYGAGISPDSVGYIAVARNVAAGRGMLTYSGEPMVMQPPLYPLLLAAGQMMFGMDPLTFSWVLNAIIFGLIIYFTGLYFSRSLENLLAFWGTLFVMISPPLIMVSHMAWTEPLFILCIVLSLYLLNDDPVVFGKMKLCLLVVLAAAASCTRLIGITIVPAYSLCIVLFDRGNRIKVRVLKALLFSGISLVPISLWVVRTKWLTGTLFGPRGASFYTLGSNCSKMLNTILLWYLPDGLIYSRYVLIILSLVAGIALGFALAAQRFNWRKLLSACGPSVLFGCAYTGLLLLTSIRTAYDPINYRLMSPVFIPLTFVILIILREVLASFPRSATVRYFLWLVAAFLFVEPLVATVHHVSECREFGGYGYNSEKWGQSELIGYLIRNQAHFAGRTIYSNIPDAVYILAGLPAKMAPSKHMYNSPDTVNTPSNINGTWPCEDSVYLVWFYNGGRSYVFSFDELQKSSHLLTFANLQDGSVSMVNRLTVE